MLKVSILQSSISLLIAVIAFAFFGVHAGISAALGGLACVLPNAVIAAYLAVRQASSRHQPGQVSITTFMVGEFVKLALTVTLLFAVAMQYRHLNWLALLVGFIAALKSYLFLFLFDRHTYGN